MQGYFGQHENILLSAQFLFWDAVSSLLCRQLVGTVKALPLLSSRAWVKVLKGVGRPAERRGLGGLAHALLLPCRGPDFIPSTHARLLTITCRSGLEHPMSLDSLGTCAYVWLNPLPLPHTYNLKKSYRSRHAASWFLSWKGDFYSGAKVVKVILGKLVSRALVTDGWKPVMQSCGGWGDIGLSAPVLGIVYL